MEWNGTEGRADRKIEQKKRRERTRQEQRYK